MADDNLIFDPNQVKADIAATFQATEKARQKAISDVANATAKIQATNEQTAKNATIYADRQEEHLTRMSDAMNNLSDIASLPQGIADFIGIFDEDYNRNVQAMELKRSEFEINRLNAQQQRANTAAALNASTAKAQAEGSLSAFNLTRQGFVDTLTAAQAGFTIEENVRARDLKQIQDLSMDDLQKYATNPELAPANLRDKPGMLQSMLIERRAQELGIQSQELNLEINRDQMERRKVENTLRKFDKNSLRAMAETGDLPPGLDIGTVQNEIARRQQVEDNLAASAISLKAARMDLAQAQKNAALNGMTIAELGEGLKEAAQQGGRIKVGAVEFTATELRAVLMQKQALEREQRNITLNSIAAQAQTSGTAAEIQTKAKGVTGATAPGTLFNPAEPMANLPPELASKMVGFQAQLDAMTELQKAGVDTVNKQVEIMTEMNEQISEYQEKFIKAQPKETENGYRQFMENGGFIEDTKAATDFLSASASPFALNYDPIMAKPFELFANKLNELSSQQVKSITAGKGGSEDAGFEIVEQGDATSNQLVTQALRESKAGEMLSQMWTQKLLADSISALAGGSEQSIWAGIVDPETGRFDERVYSEAGTFEFKKLAQLLAAKTVKYREQGIINPGQSMISVLTDKAVQNSRSLRQVGTNDPTASAFMKVAFNNNPQNAVNSILMRFREQERPALAVVLEQQDLMQREANSTVQALIDNKDEPTLAKLMQRLITTGPSPQTAAAGELSKTVQAGGDPTAIEKEIRAILNQPSPPQQRITGPGGTQR